MVGSETTARKARLMATYSTAIVATDISIARGIAFP
jgi:hypothetical protein